MERVLDEHQARDVGEGDEDRAKNHERGGVPLGVHVSSSSSTSASHKAVAKGLSPDTARQSATTLRQVKVNLGDDAFGVWLESVTLPEVLSIVAKHHNSSPSEAHPGQGT